MSEPGPTTITRREAVLRLASTAAAAAAVGAGVVAFHDRRIVHPGAAPVPDWRVPASGAGVAAAARSTDPAGNVRRAVAALGGIERFVRAGESVLIKPNVGWDRLPEQAADTDPFVVAELVRLCRSAGARRVVVADISCNDPRRCFASSGILAAAGTAGAEVFDARGLRLVPAALSGLAEGLEVVEELLRADRVINVPVVKHHSLSRVTLGMKNWFGVLGAGRNRLHQDIDMAVAELGAIFRPTLTVVDATRVLTANGPVGGSLADVRTVGAVLAATDPVLADAWGAALLGSRPQDLGFIAQAEQRGLGRADLARVAELGTA
ncbi:MAG: DUF362 domain-containing protein [Thermoanaerobaculaceae bacterium]|nr:DUF362 domain-containing protein [Thermoanaerobaculaceae bacterium]TAM56856.1 MAG: DUF362 domain-containing protein [Acidobacteriota bacterium]